MPLQIPCSSFITNDWVQCEDTDLKHDESLPARVDAAGKPEGNRMIVSRTVADYFGPGGGSQGPIDVVVYRGTE